MKRIYSHTKYKLVIYLFTEGLKTEHQYIYDYVQKNKKDALIRIIKKGCESDCVKLAQMAIDFEKKQSWDELDPPHQTWMIFDHDGNERKVNHALQLIKEYNKNCISEKQVHHALMKPCMELWALMHFRENFPEDKLKIQKELQKEMPLYNHDNHPIFDVKLLTQERYAKASVRAVGWYNSLDDKNNPNSGCYYAGIYLLMKEIDKVGS